MAKTDEVVSSKNPVKKAKGKQGKVAVIFLVEEVLYNRWLALHNKYFEGMKVGTVNSHVFSAAIREFVNKAAEVGDETH